MQFDKELLIQLYYKMLQIRFFEEKIEFGFSRNQIFGTTHLCIGQEAVPAGVCLNLTDEDYVVSTHRGHGHALAKGLDSKKMMAEIMGKVTGYCKGKGGTQHIACIEKGFLGTNGITGGGIPFAAGAAFTIKYKKRKNVSVCFFGDGATNQGTFHETLNMASMWNLPVVFICENNLYAMSTPVNKTIKTETIAERAKSFGIKGIKLNGMDVLEIYKNSKEIIEEVKNNHKPIFLEFETYRFKGHSKSD
ncbi:MAG: thiamine pyrophosphate-dependent dehydrogenase E1 component subunit alpha, partial [Candidatus Firestonebacteria bacterium]|nr:thiamine pyrophosphate-dependent dehydrogenase E1 component subunit alpha [Candidatus Firestonebacteria bacterium]